ncbi:HEPN domain protein [Pyrolobus fumarii 1A]|uniref:HEPN domain protein n=1 Tax=Pyrolobus fumarii (strain DSM 11204 / 1A) TaxID=694429 RepID=G0EF70_PYRF1|nr:HEPN domain-containing protein [Pyrolobus fumarii]AEM38967.1 HEPN domain protein [Pyrolobus fumarii 1A]
MSGEYAMLLRRRALNALRWAERACNEGDYDTCAREAEYAAQLYLKSLLYRVLGEEVRGHDIRELLAVLVSALLEQGLANEAGYVADYVRRHRRELAWLSEAHTRAAYGPVEYSRREAEIVLSTTKSVLRLAEELEEKLFGG